MYVCLEATELEQPDDLNMMFIALYDSLSSLQHVLDRIIRNANIIHTDSKPPTNSLTGQRFSKQKVLTYTYIHVLARTNKPVLLYRLLLTDYVQEKTLQNSIKLSITKHTYLGMDGLNKNEPRENLDAWYDSWPKYGRD